MTARRSGACPSLRSGLLQPLRGFHIVLALLGSATRPSLRKLNCLTLSTRRCCATGEREYCATCGRWPFARLQAGIRLFRRSELAIIPMRTGFWPAIRPPWWPPGSDFLRQYALVVLVGLPAPLTRKPRQARKGAAAAGAWATGSGGRGPPLFSFPPVRRISSLGPADPVLNSSFIEFFQMLANDT